MGGGGGVFGMVGTLNGVICGGRDIEWGYVVVGALKGVICCGRGTERGYLFWYGH